MELILTMWATLSRRSNVFAEASIAGAKEAPQVGASSFFSMVHLTVTVADFSTFSTIPSFLLNIRAQDSQFRIYNVHWGNQEC
jgi:hypothetical protein